MRAIVERVSSASVDVEGEPFSQIEKGLLVYLGVAADDTDADVKYLADKVAGLRIFEDDAGKMNLSVVDVGGKVLVISAFSLQADARKGRRPSFTAAAEPDLANKLYEQFAAAIRSRGIDVGTGQFRTKMTVHADNAGPICIMLDSQKAF